MPRNAAGYEEDFYAWTVEQAKLLRSGKFSKIDALNVAEEIESVVAVTVATLLTALKI